MRLLKSEHKQFVSIIEQEGYSNADFQFNKKSGWLSILYSKNKSAFMFHRKQTTELDENLQWRKSTSYFGIINNKKTEYESIDEVLSSFKTWLSNI